MHLLCKFFYTYGVGNIDYGSSGGAEPPFINVAGARNGLSVDTDSFIVLGQDLGETGNPAKLLSDRQIPFDGFSLEYNDVLPTTTNVQKVIFFGESSTIPFLILAGTGPDQGNGGYFSVKEPDNYNTTYTDPLAPGDTIRMDRWYWSYAIQDNGESGDGMPDAVLNFGYNINPAGGRLNNLDGSWRLGFETNFAADGHLSFEFHLPEITLFDGTIQRTQSYYCNKSTGQTLAQGTFETYSWLTTGATQNEWCRLETINEVGARLSLYTDAAGTGFGDLLFFNEQTSEISAIQGSGEVLAFTSKQGTSFFMELDVANNLWLNQNGNVGQPAAGVTIVGQVTSDLTDIDPSAQLQVWSETKGFLPPRMTTTQKNAIASPGTGLLVYDTTLNKLSLWTGAAWETVPSV